MGKQTIEYTINLKAWLSNISIIWLEVICTFIATIFAVLALAEYLGGKEFLFVAALVCLIAAKWLEIIDRIEIGESDE